MMTNAEKFRQLVEAQDQRPLSEKIMILERVLYLFTIAGRAIWSDDSLSDHQIAMALKWLNEMSHRTFDILHALRRGEDNDSMHRFYAYMRQYADECRDLGGHLGASFHAAMRYFSDD
ncbi:hypothetical protein HHL17_21395 [Chitinophaga sp. G-6-1-13]|uniref:Uncharacterized protein n=1 Tax=Chitinophaga fulva TaxID=2728842 RepID=A0A848GVP3_9BACT|nr:hypothetical protein [Chitinophaga fulva]NML39768.1 hypothetical protein [Chitinophaga fulva]